MLLIQRWQSSGRKKLLKVRSFQRKWERKMAKAKLGSGARFKAVEKAAAKGGATDPAAVAAAVGRKKYGKKKMTKLAVKGKKAGK